MRYFLELAYFGKEYHGWQRQPSATTVQEVLEDALSTILRKETEVVGAGRTDAGVHAKQLFAHVDVDAELSTEFLFRLNSLLPRDVALRSIRRVHPEAHARFDATARSYEYHLVQRKDVFAQETAYWVKRPLDVDRMNRAAEILLQYRDFKCFSRSRTDVRTYNCDLVEAYWKETNSRLVFYITADRFLRNMVRAVVGTLLQVGLGRLEVQAMHDIIKSQSRSEAGASVPAHGLFLTRIEYPNSIYY